MHFELPRATPSETLYQVIAAYKRLYEFSIFATAWGPIQLGSKVFLGSGLFPAFRGWVYNGLAFFATQTMYAAATRPNKMLASIRSSNG